MPTKYAVIGTHVSKLSKSPIFQNEWIKQHGINAEYSAIDIKTAPELEKFITNLQKDGFGGINVTVPYKEDVFRLLQRIGEVDEIAARIKAVNTIIVKDSRLIGSNTDAYGFIQNVLSSPSLPKGWKFAGKNIFILGAGGATSAVIAGLIEAGAKSITISNRTKAKAEALGQNYQPFPIKIIDWEKRHELVGIDLLVNTTTLGMAGELALDIDLSNLPKNAIVTDIVYNPLITPLLAAAEKQDNIIIDGSGMLLYQGQQSFYLWHGVRPDVASELIQGTSPLPRGEGTKQSRFATLFYITNSPSPSSQYPQPLAHG